MSAAYIDSSVLLRIVMSEPNPSSGWRSHDALVSCEIIHVEALRAIDRLRLGASLDDETVARRRALVYEFLEGIQLIHLGPAVLERASQPFPTTLGTLDALHLSSALLWQQDEGNALGAFFTHDEQLGRAARSLGLRVLAGC
ncbi:MAG: type II toxin-antitoxin system VapC family toxin [Myxococcaceae bacterium]